ncbi:MAG TPA: AraC family transcriptional regulator, partial [Lentisphaeria bacterium]|nr:AraC family transcriptional regulator [Lentisphaeria bacterium]
KEVAAAVGFSDPLHFSRVFRRSQGLPPVAFRNEER